jgi:hypothetical protein
LVGKIAQRLMEEERNETQRRAGCCERMLADLGARFPNKVSRELGSIFTQPGRGEALDGLGRPAAQRFA